MTTDTPTTDDLGLLAEIDQINRSGAPLLLATAEADWPDKGMATIDRLKATGHLRFAFPVGQQTRIVLTPRGREALAQARRAAELRAIEDRALAMAAELDPADISPRAQGLRDYARSIWDHRADAERRAARRG